jgi:hypothetical protein
VKLWPLVLSNEIPDDELTTVGDPGTWWQMGPFQVAEATGTPRQACEQQLQLTGRSPSLRHSAVRFDLRSAETFSGRIINLRKRTRIMSGGH